ncbi:flagellar hook-length control protein FliK [Azotobacter salinestris]|uniref:flagellar hook-length control protein FliK n=1 Tax=Azotobacter salinestris TaxID=69964 RepID=UPI0032DE49EE
MSGITPLLDSLLHQVLGKPVDLPTTRQGDRPVEPIVPGGAARAVHSDSRLDARSPRLLSPLLQTPQHGDETTSRPTSPGAATGPASAATRLSPAARTIADVLREHPARPSAITPGAPLLPSVDTPPVATLLAGLLRQSIGESGLFYESHLARWYRGELPLQALAREPQMGGWQPPQEGGGSSPRAGGGAAPPAVPMPGRPEAVDGETLPAESLVLESEEALQTGPALSREQVQGLVRHQLELLANPVLHWEGEAWPGLSMFLSVQAPEAERQGSARSGKGGGEAVPADERWCLRLDLDLPGHGALGVEVRLGGQSLSLTMITASPELLDYFARTERLLRERIAQCFPGELTLRCLDAQRAAESSDE